MYSLATASILFDNGNLRMVRHPDNTLCIASLNDEGIFWLTDNYQHFNNCKLSRTIDGGVFLITIKL